MSQEQHSFGAETQQLLDIVIHSLYTDKEIFLRELVSNASDALEKLRHHQLTGAEVHDADLPLEINLTTDDTAGTITIQDFGIGLTREELIENIGTIARSGSKAFAAALKEAKEAEGSDAANLIGQFGVGFYSAFMVAEEVKVYTRSYQGEGENLVWSSKGDGQYTIEETPDTQRRGAKIVVKLKEDEKDFAKKERVEGILKRYSSFIQFPLNLNGEKVNTVQALWLKQKSEVSAEEYTEFYKFQANAFDDPRYTLHFSADAPLAINALLFTPKENMEKFGLGRQDPAVALYCKKVLIDPKPEGLLPEWLRFLKGVVDSADLPLNISRESMQDSALVTKLGKVITGRVIKQLETELKKRPEDYDDFYRSFGIYLKEGAATDMDNREKIAKLLRFESTVTEAGQYTTFAEYVERMKEEQKGIYYLTGPSRAVIESGPYLEAFKANGLEVLFLTEQVDELVMNHLNEFDGKKLESADSAELELEDVAPGEGEPLDDGRFEGLAQWLKESLGSAVAEVKKSTRLVDSPMAALNADKFMTPGMRQMMRQMNPNQAEDPVRVHLDLNPRHDLIKNLDALRDNDADLAKLVAEQLRDNALVAAGYMEDPRPMVNRMNDLLTRIAKG